MKQGKRIYAPDEEPDVETIQEVYSGCRFCGHPDHAVAECPVRPLSDWIKG